MTKNLLDLAKNFERTSSEQAKITEQAVQKGLQSLEQSLIRSLKQSENTINNALDESEQQTLDKIKKLYAHKLLIGGMMGVLMALVLVLTLVLVWQGKTLTERRSELSAIEQATQAQPVQAQALAKVKIGKNADGTIWIEPAKPKKAQLGKQDNGTPIMILE